MGGRGGGRFFYLGGRRKKRNFLKKTESCIFHLLCASTNPVTRRGFRFGGGGRRVDRCVGGGRAVFGRRAARRGEKEFRRRGCC